MTIGNYAKQLFGVTLDNSAKLIDAFGIPGAHLTYPEFNDAVALAQLISSGKNAVLAANWGETTTEQALVKILTQRAIEKGSNLLTEGLEIVHREPMTDLEQNFATHERGTAEYPVSDGAIGGRQTLTWNKYQLAIEPAEFHFMISDHAKIRGEALIQQRAGLREAARSIAEKRRDNIIDTLYAGAQDTAAKTAVWSGASADIMLDIAAAYSSIVDNAEDVPLPTIDSNLYCVFPANLAGHVRDFRDASIPGVSHEKQVKEAFSLKMVPTRHHHASSAIGIQDDAMILVKSDLVAIHGTLQGGIVPLVETEREIGRGQHWVIRDFFGTIVTPRAWSAPGTISDADNDAIYLITDVV